VRNRFRIRHETANDEPKRAKRLDAFHHAGDL